MRGVLRVCGGLSFFILLLLIDPQSSLGQTREQGPWWPHPLWGPDDQVGASNWITPEKVMEALSIPRTGRIFDLGQIYDASMPLFAGRAYSLTLKAPDPAAGGANRLVTNSELLATEVGQVGTQFDGLGHIGERVRMADGTEQDVFYNGNTLEEIASPNGLVRLGIENVRPIVTRGILIDIAGAKGVPVLPHGYEVTVADVREALQRQGMSEDELRSGDALFFRYGWATHWPDPAVFNDNPPGIGLDVARWVVERQATMIGSDSYTSEVDPYTDPNLSYPVHQELITRNGIHNLENMNLEELAAQEVHEFLFMFSPVPFRGATGSPGRPIAIQ